MKDLKEYKKPKFVTIKISCEDLMDFGDVSGETEESDIKAQTFRIFDDTFDDLSIAEESDYATTTNTIEVW